MAVETGAACDCWDNAECVGTEYCPPRCPRYVDQEEAAYVIRPAGPGDLDALVDMYETIEAESRTMGLPPSGRPAIEQWLEGLAERGWNLVAFRGDRAVGHVGVAPAEAEDPQFVIFVHQDCQNRGLGTELVNQTVAYAADREYDALTLSVSRGNRRAVHVYKNVGFELEGDGDRFTAGDLDLEMRLPLSAPIADQVRLPPAER
ncbi:MAG: GNAT family N-acetyltransferase [Halobacteriales archaeon]|nr:GNAT family N-acetyltransferase [Halobacteriales archaeon]